MNVINKNKFCFVLIIMDPFVLHGYNFWSTLYYDKKQVSKVDKTRFF